MSDRRSQYIYWLLSCFTVDVQGNARNGGIFRSVEAIGQAVSYGINSNVATRFIPLYVSPSFLEKAYVADDHASAINFALAGFCIPFTLAVIQKVPLYRADALNAPANLATEHETKVVDEEDERKDRV